MVAKHGAISLLFLAAGIILLVSPLAAREAYTGVPAAMVMGAVATAAGLLARKSPESSVLAGGAGILASGAYTLVNGAVGGAIHILRPSMALAAGTAALVSLIVASGFATGRLRFAIAAIAGIVVPFLAYYSMPFYPWLAGYSLVLAVSGAALSFSGASSARSAAPLVAAAGLAGTADPVLAGPVVIAGGLMLAWKHRSAKSLLGVLGPLLLASSVVASSVYPVAGPVAAVAGLVLITLEISGGAPESALPGLALGVILYMAGVRAGLDPAAAAALFMAGSGAGLAYRALRQSGWSMAPIASAALIIALAAPLAAPLASTECSLTVDTYSYGSSQAFARVELADTIEKYYSSVESVIEGLDGAQRLAALTLMDPEVPGKVTTPGLLANLTVKDVATGTNLTLEAGPSDFLFLPLNETLHVFFAVDTEDMVLRAAARLPWIIIPVTLIGDLRPNPVHTALIANFTVPLIVTLPGGASLVIYQAVIAPSFIAGGPRTIATDTPLGVEWTNVTIGVVRGSLVYPTGSIQVPLSVDESAVEAMNLYLDTKNRDPAGALAIATIARLLLQGLTPGSGESLTPEVLWLNASTPAGNVSYLLFLTGEGYREAVTHAQVPDGLNYLVILATPGEAEFSDVSVNYLYSLGAYAALQQGGPRGLAAASSLLARANHSDATAIAWAATHVIPLDPAGPEPSLECYRAPLGVLALLAPFLVAPAAGAWLRSSRPPR